MELLNVCLVILSLLGTVIVVSSSDDSSERKKREIDTLEDSNSDFLTPDKRRPGWGKRSYDDELLNNLDKRRPGWGKRSDSLYDTEVDKRRPGWGKRDNSLYDVDKRRPGWGKRSSSPLLDDLNIYKSFVKRRPGWGKRSDSFRVETRRPGWGKRTPGWGKRSSMMCMEYSEAIRQLSQLLAEIYTPSGWIKNCVNHLMDQIL